MGKKFKEGEFVKGQILSNGYEIGRGREPLNLTEKQIRYAMKNSKSNAGAARFLNVAQSTYWKYAKMYIDEDTGKNLYELHSNQAGIGISQSKVRSKYSLDEILEGKHPDYPVYKLKARLLKNGEQVDFPCKCHNCGYDEARIIDGRLPLILDHVNDDWSDHRKENLRFLCYNCYHNLKANIIGSQPRWRMEQVNLAKKKRNERLKNNG